MFVFVGGQEKPNGISSYINNIGLQLVKLGHAVTIFQFGSCNKEYDLQGMRILQHKAPQNSMLAIPYIFLCSIPFIITNRKEIKMVNFQTTFAAFIAGWVCRLVGVNACYTQHSFGEDNPKHVKMTRYLISLISKISVICCGSNFITISKSKAAEFKAKNGKDCRVIPCGVNRPIEKYDSDILERSGIKKNGYFLIICRIDPVKNLDILIKAFLKHNNQGFRLVIGGDYQNVYGDELIRIVNKNPDIVFVGSVSGNDKETLLRNCYANCLVSSSEGMPISLMEGMAYAKPCIVSDIPSIREIVTKKQGCWCKVNDINGLAEQFEFAETYPQLMLEKGRSMADCVFAKYTWEVIVKEYVKLCEEIRDSLSKRSKTSVVS